MKLYDYAVREAMDMRLYKDAITLVSSSFGISLPLNFRIDIMRDPCFVPEIEIFSYGKVYCWHLTKGFFNIECKYSTVIVADVYVPHPE